MTLKEALLYAISIGYHTDDSGNLFKKDKISKANRINRDGYKILQTRISGKNVYILIHRIIAFQKFGNKIFDPGIEVRHLDGNKLNNHPDNILIGTHSENMFDVPLNLRMHRTRKGALKTRRFSYEEAEQIRKEHNQGLSYKELSTKYKIGKSVISYIINRKTYNDIDHY